MEPIYNCAEAGEILEKSPVTVRANARQHNIGRKKGRDWIFTDEDIEALRQLPGPGRPPKEKELPQ